MKALVSIDYSYDFIAQDGALTTAEAGQQIEVEMVTLCQQFLHNNDFLIFAIDAHDPNDHYHPENKLFPAHNVIGTQGQQLFGSLHNLYTTNKHKDNLYWINKRHYSAFSGTDLDIRLRERKITTIHLAGVCTDICILHTAVDAYNLGYDIVIHQQAVASFDPVGHDWALQHCKHILGATII